MEVFEQISLVLDGLLITLALVWISWKLCHVIGIGLGGLAQDLADDGDFDHSCEVHAGGDGSEWDIVEWIGGFFE